MRVHFRKHSGFCVFSLLFVAVMLINCFITPSPYSALHSGKVGTYMSSTRFTLNPAYLLIICVAITCLIDLHIYKTNIAYILCLIIIVTGFLNGGLFSDSFTYIYDVLSITLVSQLAKTDARKKNELNAGTEWNICLYEKDYNLIYWLMVILFVLGLILVYIFPGRFGILYFEFNRSTRGEVTIWNLFFVSVFLLIYLLIDSSKKNSSPLQKIITIIACFVTASTSSRTLVLIYLVCLMLAWIEQRFDLKKFVGLIIIGLTIFVGYNYLSDFFLLGQNSEKGSLETILNGRLGLWKYYWSLFRSHPIIGYGQVTITEQLRLTLGASSEIGILKNATNYGLFFALFELYIIIKSVVKSLVIIRNRDRFDEFDHLITYLFWCSFPLIIQQHARILNYSNFLFWYTSFFMFSRDVNNCVRTL